MSWTCRGQSTSRPLQARHPKELHVSPFLSRELDYQWRLNPPGKRLVVHIQTSRVARETVRRHAGAFAHSA